MSKVNLLLGVLAGVAAGALAGVLFAPDKDSVTRINLLKESGDYAEGLTEKIDQFIDKIGGKFEVAKAEVEKASKSAREKLNSATS